MNKMKKLHIAIDFESQSMDVSVNDARECVTPASTVEEMYAKEVFAIRPVNESPSRQICNLPAIVGAGF